MKPASVFKNRCSIIFFRVIFNCVASLGLIRLYAFQDSPEVPHVAADVLELRQTDFLTIGERIEALLLFG